MRGAAGETLALAVPYILYTHHQEKSGPLPWMTRLIDKGVGRVMVEGWSTERRSLRTETRYLLHLCGGFFCKWASMWLERGALPLKAWKDCIRCPKFPGLRRGRHGNAFSAPDRSVEPPPPLRVDSALRRRSAHPHPGTANPSHLRARVPPK